MLGGFWTGEGRLLGMVDGIEIRDETATQRGWRLSHCGTCVCVQQKENNPIVVFLCKLPDEGNFRC